MKPSSPPMPAPGGMPATAYASEFSGFRSTPTRVTLTVSGDTSGGVTETHRPPGPRRGKTLPRVSLVAPAPDRAAETARGLDVRHVGGASVYRRRRQIRAEETHGGWNGRGRRGGDSRP